MIRARSGGGVNEIATPNPADPAFTQKVVKQLNPDALVLANVRVADQHKDH